MQQELLNILLTALGTIITGLVGWGVAAFNSWISTKTNDIKFNSFVNGITALAGNAVKEVYQTYVETLKKEGNFGKDAQEKAFDMCFDKLMAQLTPGMLDFIGKNFGDITDYLTSVIEATLYNLKQY